MWANEILLVLVSILLATWGAIYLRKNSRIDFTLGVSILITSLILFFWGITKIVIEVVSAQDQYLKVIIFISCLLLWITAFIVGRSDLGRRLAHGAIQAAVIMPIIFWFISLDEVYTWEDTFLYMSLTFMISVMAFRRNKSIFT